ncbi:hypothetical protein N9937_01035 [bacterium]|nr:hypothetical protein [bacterium]
MDGWIERQMKEVEEGTIIYHFSEGGMIIDQFRIFGRQLTRNETLALVTDDMSSCEGLLYRTKHRVRWWLKDKLKYLAEKL